MGLAVEVYRLSARFSPQGRYRRTAQITRAVASVPANIAERGVRTTRKDYASFLAIAKGSLMETETFVMLAVRLGYLSEAETSPTLALITEINKMLTALRSRLLQAPG